MKSLVIQFLVCLFVISGGHSVFAQDDETRQSTGLPMMIGENASNRNKGNLSGKITIEGLNTSQNKPTIFVTVLLNGAPIEKRQASDSGNYFIPGVPRENVVLVVEVNGTEVGRQRVPSSTMGNIRQDMIVNLGQSQSSTAKTGVISATDSYLRTEEDERLFENAMAASKEKKPGKAISLFKQIVDRDPKDFVAWTELGTLYFKDEKYPESEQAYIKALEQNIEYMVALMNLGKFYLNQNQANKAILILSKAVEVEPSSANAQYYLGEAYLSAKKGSVAIVYLNEAIRLAPIEKAEVHLRLALLYNGAGMKDKAVEEYQKFLVKVPKYPEKEKLEKYIKENSHQ